LRGKLRGSTFGSLPKNEGVRLLSSASHNSAHLRHKAAGGRSPCCRRWGDPALATWHLAPVAPPDFFWIPPCWRRPEPMAWPVGLRSGPLFSRAVNYGAPCPVIFRPFLAPNAHREPRHCSPPVLRLAADLATPLAGSRSAHCRELVDCAFCALCCFLVLSKRSSKTRASSCVPKYAALKATGTASCQLEAAVRVHCCYFEQCSLHLRLLGILLFQLRCASSTIAD
jgi:hypothetical protein